MTKTPAVGGRKVAIDVLGTAALQVIAKARGLILLPIIIRAGGEALYGGWTLLGGIVAFMVPLANLSAHQGLMRYAAPVGAPDARTLFRRVTAFSWTTASLTSLAVAAFVFTLGSTSAWYAAPAIIGFTAAQVPLLVAVRVNSSYLRARGRVAAAQLTELTAQLVMTLAVCVVFLAAGSLGMAQGVAAAVLFVQVALVTAWTLKSRDLLPNVSSSAAAGLRPVLAFSAPLVPGAISDWALFIADRYILAAFHGPTTVGIYAACYSLAQGLQLASYPVEYAIAPLLPRLWDGDERRRAVDLLRRSTNFVLMVLAPGSTVASIVGPPLFRLLGLRATADQATLLLPIVCWGITIFAFTRLLGHVCLVANRGRAVMVRVGATAAINIALNLALVPSLGAVGAALATLGSYAIYCVLILRLAREIAPEAVHLQLPTRICVAALAPAPIALLPFGSDAARVGGAFAYLVIYAGLCAALQVVVRDDWELLVRTVRRRKA